MDKIALFTQILEQNPTDAFTRYSLAMAYAGEGDTNTALTEFDKLIGHNADYVPAYQMSAEILTKLGRTDEAIQRLHGGIAAANRTGNQHALAEMEVMREEIS